MHVSGVCNLFHVFKEVSVVLILINIMLHEILSQV
jgi:hypothetical protein